MRWAALFLLLGLSVGGCQHSLPHEDTRSTTTIGDWTVTTSGRIVVDAGVAR